MSGPEHIHPSDEMLPIEGLPQVPEARFDISQRRAFGSIPGLLGKEIDVPPFHRLSEWGYGQTEPDILRRGLYGVSGNTAVNGLALTAEQHEAIVRNHGSFNTAIRNKTVAANRLVNDERRKEKELDSITAALENKEDRHLKVLTGLSAEQKTLAKLSEWQQVPGYQRTNELELRVLAGTAWHGSFMNILSVLRDQHELSPEQMIELSQALAYRLTRGPQRDRMANWGGMLRLGLDYNHSVSALFASSLSHIESDLKRLRSQKETHDDTTGIQHRW